jgi:hypothetical protein
MRRTMQADFVQEIVEHDRLTITGCLTGWETIVFELDDEPEESSGDV